MGAEVGVCGRNALRLLPDLPLRQPAGRHVGNLHNLMSFKKPDIGFLLETEVTAGAQDCSRVLRDV